MTALTMEQLIAQEERKLAREGTAPRPLTTTHQRRGGQGDPTKIKKHDGGQINAFAYGAADTITFGFLDEAGAWVDSTLPTWLGGSGESYDEALERNRAILRFSQEEYSTSHLVGQVSGGFLPAFGWAGRIKGAVSSNRLMTGVGGMAVSGGAYGALYGIGSADGDVYDRLRNGAVMGLYGAAGGYVLGALVIPAGKIGLQKTVSLFQRGRAPAITAAFKPKVVPAAALARTETEAADLAAAAIDSGTKKAAPKPVKAADPAARHNDLTGKLDDALDTGMVVSSKELFRATPTAALSAALNRIQALTPQQAKRMAQQLQKAEADGTVINHPHYRSLLGIDAGADTDAALQAATVFEEATAALLAKAGLPTKRTTKSVDAEMRARYGDVLTDAEVDAAVARSTQAVTDGRIGTNLMMMAGLQFSRAKAEFLPDLLNGSAEARDKLTDALTNAIRLSAKGRLIAGNLGRALGDMSKSHRLAFSEVAGDTLQIESREAISARVQQSLKELDDGTLSELLGRLRNVNDLDEIEDILLNADRAKEVSAWRRTFNSVGLFIKSNSLTPMSGLVNVVGAISHDFFRNTAAKRWAARNFEIAGQADEALKLRFETAVASSVYWEANKRGMTALLQRVQWEFWDSVEKIAGVGFGSGKVAAKASTSKIALMADGYSPPALREFDKMGRAAVTDVAAFNQRMADKAQGGAFARLAANLERAGAVALNTVDALGTATARIVSGALDDWGSAFVRVKETYAYTARFALNEGLQLGLSERELVEYAGRRTEELIQLPPSEVLQRVEDKLLARQDLDDTDRFLLSVTDDAEKEASRVMFMDGPQTSGGRLAAQSAAAVDKIVSLNTVQGMLMTYIRTPTRIFERGLVSYTPWGHKAEEVQAILKWGGVEAEIEMARMELGTMLIGIGATAGFTGAITMTNGGFDNSRNLEGAPPNRINLPGGGYVELGRLDPFALTIALGGFVGQALKSYQDNRGEYEAEEAVHTALQIAYLGVRDAILEKSYMTGLRDLTKAAFSEDGDGMAAGWQKMVEGAITRTTPFAGTIRQVNDTVNGEAPEAVSLMDKVLRTVPGFGHRLPPRVDALGDPVEGRFMGLAAGSKNTDDAVKRQLIDLDIDVTNLNKTDPAGFKLNSEELSELRRIRGHEATDANGMTMREALADLFADPEFRTLPTKQQKQDRVRDAMRPFSQSARTIFEERNPQYAADRAGNKAFLDYLAQGYGTADAKAIASEDVAALGLPAASRVP